MKKGYIFETPIGRIFLVEEDQVLTHLCLPNSLPPQTIIFQKTAFLQKVAKQLEEYFNGTRTEFTIPLHPQGTDFQKKCWQALQKIPYGKTCSYQEIASAIGNPKACRAVGMANHYNPIAILIPCHRVIGANGKLVGYGGGLNIKQYLLQLEQGRKLC